MIQATPIQPPDAAAQLQALGLHIRTQRKALRISAVAAAEAAGISRVTLHRIEKGEPTVTMGAYCGVLAALGLSLKAQAMAPTANATPTHKGWIPARIALADYPQLKLLAWQVHGTDTLTPTEALGIYERNARHLDTQTMTAAEQDLLDALRVALSTTGEHV